MTAPKRRGRPSENSRQKVLETARHLLASDRESDLTMARVAKELGVVTMALYKHVKNKDDLLEGVAELVFAEIELELVEGDDWQPQLDNWARQIRAFFHDNPYVLQLIGWEKHMSRAWLSLTASLATVLKAQGLTGDTLAINVQWFIRTLVSYLMLEITVEDSSSSWINYSDLECLDEEDYQNLAPIMPCLKQRTTEDEFNYFLERTITALKLVIDSEASC